MYLHFLTGFYGCTISLSLADVKKNIRSVTLERAMKYHAVPQGRAIPGPPLYAAASSEAAAHSEHFLFDSVRASLSGVRYAIIKDVRCSQP